MARFLRRAIRSAGTAGVAAVFPPAGLPAALVFDALEAIDEEEQGRRFAYVESCVHLLQVQMTEVRRDLDERPEVAQVFTRGAVAARTTLVTDGPRHLAEIFVTAYQGGAHPLASSLMADSFAGLTDHHLAVLRHLAAISPVDESRPLTGEVVAAFPSLGPTVEAVLGGLLSRGLVAQVMALDAATRWKATDLGRMVSDTCDQ